jgi:hypothetical protein
MLKKVFKTSGDRGKRKIGLVSSVFLIATLVIYLANVEIPVGYIEPPRYSIAITKRMNISIERIYYNPAYPLEKGSNISIEMIASGSKVLISGLRYDPGSETRPSGAHAMINLTGDGPWNIYLYDEYLRREMLVGVVDRSTELIVQTGLYSALVSVNIFSDMRLEIEGDIDSLNPLIKIIYINNSREVIDLGPCRIQYGSKCVYSLERQDLLNYSILFYRDAYTLRLWLNNGYLVIKPHDNPQIFLTLSAATLIIMIASAIPIKVNTSKKKKKIPSRRGK